MRTHDATPARAVLSPPRPAERFHWTTAELVAIGVFAALIRVVGLAITLAGGGMNPLAMMLRNTAATALLVVLLHKSPKTGTLCLYAAVYGLLSLLLMGSGLMGLPGRIAAALLVDALIACAGGYRSTGRILVAVALFDQLALWVSVGISYLMARERMDMFWIGAAVVAVGYLGCLPGLWVGAKFVRELRLAGVIRR